MRTSPRAAFIVVVGAQIVAAPAALGQETSTPELLDRIAELESKSAEDDARNAELEARLDALESERDEAWLTEARADEIRNLVEDVLADAETRASFLQDSLAAGYDEGFIIQSADGNWLLRTNFLMQQRLVVNRQGESLGDDSRWGFENTRTKFILTGHAVSPDLFYKAEIELASVSTGFPNGESRTGLLDAFIGYDFGQGWRMWFGTFKTPILREELVDSSSQLAVERSVVNYVFTGGRTDGLAVEYRNADFRVVGSYNNGIDDGVYGGALMTGGTSPIFGASSDLALTARGEWLMEGTWHDVERFNSPPGGDRALMLGGAAHYQITDDDATGAGDLDLLLLTADFTGQLGGASVFAAVIYAHSDMAPGTDADAIGIVVQGGYHLSEEWELFARYEWSDLDTLASSDISIITVGATRYLAGQSLTWTTDIGFGIDPVPVGVPVTGWRVDLPGEDLQFVIRSQLQLVF